MSFLSNWLPWATGRRSPADCSWKVPSTCKQSNAPVSYVRDPVPVAQPGVEGVSDREWVNTAKGEQLRRAQGAGCLLIELAPEGLAAPRSVGKCYLGAFLFHPAPDICPYHLVSALRFPDLASISKGSLSTRYWPAPTGSKNCPCLCSDCCFTYMTSASKCAR